MRWHAGMQTGVPMGRSGGQVTPPRSAPSQTSPQAASRTPLPHAASQGTGGGKVVTVVDDVVVEVEEVVVVEDAVVDVDVVVGEVDVVVGEVVAVEDVAVEVDVVVVVDVVMVVVVVGQPGICSQKPSGLIQAPVSHAPVHATGVPGAHRSVMGSQVSAPLQARPSSQSASASHPVMPARISTWGSFSCPWNAPVSTSVAVIVNPLVKSRPRRLKVLKPGNVTFPSKWPLTVMSFRATEAPGVSFLTVRDRTFTSSTLRPNCAATLARRSVNSSVVAFGPLPLFPWCRLVESAGSTTVMSLSLTGSQVNAIRWRTEPSSTGDQLYLPCSLVLSDRSGSPRRMCLAPEVPNR